MKVSNMDEFVFLWKEYGKRRDSKLTQDAVELKKQIRLFVESLPTFQENLKMKGASDSLSSEEIKDVAIAEKELASGKCKTFKTAEDMIADLYKKRKRRLRNE